MDRGVRSAGDAHRAVDVGTARKRVADRAADTGCSAAEGLDLGRMVVRFIFEQQQPRFRDAVDVHVDLDRTGVDFFRFVQFVELTGLFQRAHRDGRDIHQADRLGSGERFARGKIAVVGVLQELIFKRYVVDHGQERRVTAVIGPVGIDHADLGDRGVALLRAEVLLAECDIVRVHR